MAVILFLDGPVPFASDYAITFAIASTPLFETASDTGQKPRDT
jgi:hypothetical protein